MAGKSGRRVYRSKRWQLLRLRIIERDERRCFKCDRICGRPEVHHTKPIAKSNPSDWWNPEVLRTVCRGCHILLSRAEQTRPISPARRRFMEMANA